LGFLKVLHNFGKLSLKTIAIKKSWELGLMFKKKSIAIKL